MKISAITLWVNAIASKMMGISCSALNGPTVTEPHSFWETLGYILLHTLTGFIEIVGEMIIKFIYSLSKWVLTIIDFIFIFIRQVIGLNTDFTSLEEISKSDMIFQFLFNENVLRVIRGMIGLAIILIILFSIISILKSELDFATNGGANSKKQILVSALKSFFLILIVPVIAVGGIVLSNAILKSIYMATAGGADVSMGSQVFVPSGYQANAYRRYADRNLKIPITFNFDQVGENDNINSWGSDGGVAELDEALKAFKSSDVWNRGFSTFTMFYTDGYLLMNTVDKLNNLYKDEGKTSPYHDLYDKGLYTSKDEYYVMADVVEYSMRNNMMFYFKTAQDVYQSYYQMRANAPRQVVAQMEDSIPIHQNGKDYTFDVNYLSNSNSVKYTHTANATDEAKGAVFIVALERNIEYKGKVYTYYYPLLSSEDNFYTDYYSKTDQIVIAKGLFEEGEKPTAIKLVDGNIKFYRDQLNIPTLLDFFPKISYEKPEGVTENLGVKVLREGISLLTGINVDDFIPYVYYSFDIFSLFTKKTYNIAELSGSGMKVDYNFSQDGYTITNLYKMLDFNVIILVFCCMILLGMLIKIMFGICFRVLDITLLAITYPAVVSTLPLDGGSRFKEWSSQFINKLVSIYGVIIGVNVMLLLMPTIYTFKIFTPQAIQSAINMHVLPAGITAGLLNFLLSLLFILVGFTMIEKAGNIFEILITGDKDNAGGIMKEGATAVNDLKQLPNNIGNFVSGKFVFDIAKKATTTATSFIPGGAFVAEGVSKIKHAKSQSKLTPDAEDLINKAQKTQQSAPQAQPGSGNAGPSGGAPVPGGAGGATGSADAAAASATGEAGAAAAGGAGGAAGGAGAAAGANGAAAGAEGVAAGAASGASSGAASGSAGGGAGMVAGAAAGAGVATASAASNEKKKFEEDLTEGPLAASEAPSMGTEADANGEADNSSSDVTSDAESDADASDSNEQSTSENQEESDEDDSNNNQSEEASPMQEADIKKHDKENPVFDATDTTEDEEVLEEIAKHPVKTAKAVASGIPPESEGIDPNNGGKGNPAE